MHNLHLVRINATSPEEACNDVENQIMDFGNENNWRCIGGCVSEDNEVFDYDEYSRWKPSYEGYETIEKLSELVRGWMKSDNDDFYRKDLIEAIDNGDRKLSEITDTMELYAIQEFAKKRKAVISSGGIDDFDIMESSYRDYDYDECGLTSMDYSEKSEGEKTYIVFIDMHS